MARLKQTPGRGCDVGLGCVGVRAVGTSLTHSPNPTLNPFDLRRHQFRGELTQSASGNCVAFHLQRQCREADLESNRTLSGLFENPFPDGNLNTEKSGPTRSGQEDTCPIFNETIIKRTYHT